MSTTKVDELVAEHVFGCRWITCIRDVTAFSAQRSYLRQGDEAAAILREWPEHFTDGISGDPIRGQQAPHYSTDIAEAWLVVDKMYGRGMRLTLFAPEGWLDWNAKFTRYPDLEDIEGDEASAEAEAAPMAICLAALRALGVNDEAAA